MTEPLLGRPPLSRALQAAEIEHEIADAVEHFRPKLPSVDAGALIVAERQATHGKFSDNARVVQAIKHAIRSGVNWDDLSFRQREALDQIAVKMARIVSGDPDHPDHWLDIKGAAHLGEGK